MSYWINSMRCNKCGLIMQVAGGVVGTQHMGPDKLKCIKEGCNNEGFENFENLGPMHMASFQIPRKNQTMLWIDAEKAIGNAMGEVEKLGADVLLTEAVILLDKAREKVAEFLDKETT